MTYEEDIGKAVIDAIAGMQITNQYLVELDETIDDIRDERYRHSFSTELYGVTDRGRKKIWRGQPIEGPLVDNEHFSIDGKPLARTTLKIVLKYLQKNKPANWGDATFAGPNLIEARVAGNYTSTLIINLKT